MTIHKSVLKNAILQATANANIGGNFQKQYQDAMESFTRSVSTAAGQGEAISPTEQEPIKVTPPPPLFKDVVENLPGNLKKFSEVFGFAPPSGHDRLGPVYTAAEFDKRMHSFVPAVNPIYFMPQEETEALWHAHIDSDSVWLHGQSGTGKSSLEEQFCAYIGQPFLRFNGREDIEASALFGQLTVEGDSTVWKDGLLTEGVKYGARVLMDEATAIPAGVWLGMQWLGERGGKLMLTDKPADATERLIDPDPRFRLTFADNTRGQGDDTGGFSGTNVMNTAMLNRIGLSLEIKFLKKEQEIIVLKNMFGDKLDDRLFGPVVDLAAMLRKGLAEEQISLSFSMRSMTSMLRKSYNYRSMPVQECLNRAFNESYGNLLPSAEERGAAANFFGLAMSSLWK